MTHIERDRSANISENTRRGDNFLQHPERASNMMEAKRTQGPHTGRESKSGAHRRVFKARGPLEQFCGRLIIILTLVSFILIGLVLNCVQLILTLTIRLSSNRQWRKMHKRLHGSIVYAIFSQPVYLLHVWPQWELTVLLDDVKLMDEIQDEVFGIVIPNHTYVLDWMPCFLMADHLGSMGNYKCFSKDELKWLPIIGWTFWMADLIYVKRDWRQDRIHIRHKLDQLLDYDQFLLGIFAEGTRWTQEKHDDAVEFAKRRNLEPYKHHLFPRPRGFNFTMRHYLRRAATGANNLRPEKIRLFNLEIIMPDRPKFKTFLEGGLMRASIYCEEVPISEEVRKEALESRDEDECPKLTKLLQDIFRRKDKIVEEFYENGEKFPLKSPNCGYFPVKKPVKPFLYWLVGMSITYGTFTYLAMTVFWGSLTFWTIVVGFLTSGMLLLKRIERETIPTKLRKRHDDQENVPSKQRELNNNNNDDHELNQAISNGLVKRRLVAEHEDRGQQEAPADDGTLGKTLRKNKVKFLMESEAKFATIEEENKTSQAC